MLHVHDQVAGRQRRQLGEEGVGALAALLAADEAVAEHVLLGEDRHFGPLKPWSSGRTISAASVRAPSACQLLASFRLLRP